MRSNNVRKEEIEHKLAEMLEYIKEIEEFLPSDEEDFLEDIIKKHGIYKIAESAIEDVIKICSMINSDLGLGIPYDESSISSIINNLKNKEIITKKLAAKINKMKGFRNILVYRYGKIDDREAFKNIKNNLEDFDKFKEEILRFLKKSTGVLF